MASTQSATSNGPQSTASGNRYLELPPSVADLYRLAITQGPGAAIQDAYQDIQATWYQRCRNFLDKFGSLRAVNAHMERRLGRRDATINALAEELSRTCGIEATLRESNTALAWKERSLTVEVVKLRSELSGQAEKLSAAQDAAKAIMEQSRTFAMSDDDIRMRLAAVAADWQDWVRQYAHRDVALIQSLSRDDKTLLENSVSEFAILDTNCLQEVLFQGAQTKGTPGLFLQGMLASFMSATMFKSPETALRLVATQVGGIHDTEQELQTKADTISELLRVLTTTDEKGGHQTRAMIIRTLSGLLSSHTEGSSSAQAENLHKAQLQISRCYAEEFLKGAARFLCKELDAENMELRNARLAELVEQALIMSTQLWSQRSRVYCGTMEFFDATIPQDQNHTEPHKSQIRLVEEDEAAYHNLPLGMVVQPAILAIGTEDGQRYHEVTRVWLKAQLWRIPHPTM
ncbi:uncharacterized protein B0I36DRAFT_365041 [Microdochium trichocladiopsis]|uniref:Uncharacterized protein n=1 Tax=Microdochium trichocladiopsis TaxID=1682393 RepID=A0A9P9BNM8_9PEZI|nr:uncharacterized protein B0I36DRAFT_365041 [Microdochium trichocladiopsis]KAH7027908.1 hypothetical protein B0I36DRAFT_365041 [Microdochium trichocladiopsis]